MANSSNNYSTVIVVGAGLSGESSSSETLYNSDLTLNDPTGLSCAKWLKDSGVPDVTVLEARDRVGGRTLTKRDPNSSNWVDLGASYVGPTQDYILRLIKEFGLQTYLIKEDQDLIYYTKVGDLY